MHKQVRQFCDSVKHRYPEYFSDKIASAFIVIKPGKVVTARFGEIDFSAKTIGIEIIKSLYEIGLTFLIWFDRLANS